MTQKDKIKFLKDALNSIKMYALEAIEINDYLGPEAAGANIRNLRRIGEMAELFNEKVAE